MGEEWRAFPELSAFHVVSIQKSSGSLERLWQVLEKGLFFFLIHFMRLISPKEEGTLDGG